MATILVVDDELSMREFLTILLEKEGHTALPAADAENALKIAAAEKLDLVISDIRMPGIGGLELLEKVKSQDSSLPFIMITAYASPEDAVNAMKHGAYDYITKPFKVEEIVKIVDAALHSDPPAGNDAGNSHQFSGIIGSSAEMLKIFDIIKRIAPTHANVLIHGESGTGKELVARSLHTHSNVADKPFIPINCSAIPESLFESELFGHVKGSFTGAHTSKIGLMESANNGSIFLDEIGELTPMLQSKLLRVIQEREFKPVGSTETKKVNVRIISATNKDLEREVMAGTFREDLFYRLAVVPVRLPPLRERKDDIPQLINHFLRKYSQKFHKDINSISSYALEVLMEYDFPGNIRELENIIERGVAMENSNIVLPESLTLSTHRKLRKIDAHLPGIDESEDLYEKLESMGLEEILETIEKKLILQALKKTNFSKMKAAEQLKISFRSLRYKVQKYNISN